MNYAQPAVLVVIPPSKGEKVGSKTTGVNGNYDDIAFTIISAVLPSVTTFLTSKPEKNRILNTLNVLLDR